MRFGLFRGASRRAWRPVTRRADRFRLFAKPEAFETRQLLTVFVVKSLSGNVADQNSLPWAIQQANNTPGFDEIVFDIPGDGPHTITLTTPLPTITERVAINAFTQAGAQPNTLEFGNNMIPGVILRGPGVGVGAGFRFQGEEASGSILQGFSIANFQDGVAIQGASNVAVLGNLIGVDGNIGRDGVLIDQTANRVVIGAPSPAARNVIGGAGRHGLNVAGFQAVIQNNYIGVDRDGTTPRPNQGDGLNLTGGEILVGGLLPGQGNVISANTGRGIFVGPAIVVDTIASFIPESEPVPVPDADANGPGVLEVPIFVDEGGDIINLAVSLELEHPRSQDLRLTLIGPDGTEILLANQRGDGPDNYFFVTFAEGGDPLPPAGVPLDILGIYQPEQSLAGFVGRPVRGNYILRIEDLVPGEEALLGLFRWELNLTRRVSDNTIQNNTIGTDVLGVLDRGNGNFGVVLSGATNTVLGDPAGQAGNLISGNNNGGVLVTGASAANNRILGNTIGTNRAGNAPLGSLGVGISVVNAANTIIGAPGAGNLIAGNAGGGVQVTGASATNTTILANIIGASRDGTAAVPNGGVGVLIESATATILGAPGAGNLIAGNTQQGVVTRNDQATVIQANRIGLSAAGVTAIPNGGDGLLIDGSAGLVVGGTSPAFGNVISGNNGNGVALANRSTPQAATVASPDTGLAIPDNPASTGGPTEPPVVASLTLDPDAFPGVFTAARVRVQINHSFVSDLRLTLVTPSGDRILLMNRRGGDAVNMNVLFDPTASQPIATQTRPAGSPLNGTFRPEGNLAVLVGRAMAGEYRLEIVDLAAQNVGTLVNFQLEFNFTRFNTDAVLQNNTIGLDPTGVVPVPNTGNGVRINGMSGATILENLISGNFGSGILLAQAPGLNDLGVRVEANRIGVGSDGVSSRGNRRHGVEIQSTFGHQIVGNTIAGNLLDGVNVTGDPGPSARPVTIQGNQIGLPTAPNQQNGVFLNGARRVLIGGEAPGQGNVIQSNNLNGVATVNNAINNQIIGNRIFGNIQGLPIDLNSDGVTPLEIAAAPTLTQVLTSSGQTLFSGSFQGVPNGVYRVEFFADDQPFPSVFGDARFLLGSVELVADATGVVTFDQVAIPNPENLGPYYTASATLRTGGTTQFGATFPQLTADIATTFRNLPTSVTIGQTFTYDIVVTNLGNDTAASVFLFHRPPANVQVLGQPTILVPPNGAVAAFTNGNVVGVIPTLAPGAEFVLRVQARVSAFVTPTVLTATATSNELDPSLDPPGNNTGTSQLVIDAEASAFQFAQAQVSVAENVAGGLLTIEVQRVGGTAGQATVQVAVVGGTAVLGVDFAGPALATLTFADGQASQTLIFTIVNNTLVDGDRTIVLQLANPSIGNLGDLALLTITIVDDDGNTGGGAGGPPTGGGTTLGRLLNFPGQVFGVGQGRILNGFIVDLPANFNLGAVSLASFSLMAPGNDGLPGTNDDQAIALTSIRPIPGTRQIYVTTAQPFSLDRAHTLLIDGELAGDAVNDFVATLFFTETPVVAAPVFPPVLPDPQPIPAPAPPVAPTPNQPVRPADTQRRRPRLGRVGQLNYAPLRPTNPQSQRRPNARRGGFRPRG